jgi:DNA-binding protein HU-beta
MNKGEFIDAVAERLDAPRTQAEKAVAAVLDVITDQLAKGQKIALTGFGAFEIQERPARTGRNPKTGEPIQIGASRSPRFSPGSALKSAVSDKPETKA